MFDYVAYGLHVRSDLALPGLDPAPPASEPEVVIEASDVGSHIPGSVNSDRRFIVTFQGLVDFDVADGVSIKYNVRDPSVDPDVLPSRLLGEIMAGLLRQRGLLVLHACAVEKDGRAVAFFGESGWGKSTLAAYFCQNGYRLLTDDVMAIDGTTVLPSYPQIRLKEDSARHFGSSLSLEPVERNGPKWAQNGLAMPTDAVPLHGLYLLEPGYRERAEVVPVGGAEALMALVAHTRAKTLVNTNAPGLLRQHLDQCAGLVRAVPPRVLRRRHSLDALGEVLGLVEADLERHTAPTTA